jgi:hypothetical protein
MTSTQETPASPVDVSGLGVREALLAAGAERRQADRSEANLLELAIQVVHLFPVTEDTCTATWDPSASLLDDPEPVAGIGTPPVAEQAVEELGAATLDLIRDWLQRTNRVTVNPVLDMSRSAAVDQHDPPPWMRDLVILRDGNCVFPGCNDPHGLTYETRPTPKH